MSLIYEILAAGKGGVSQSFRVELAAGKGTLRKEVGVTSERGLGCIVDGEGLGVNLDVCMIQGGALSLLIGGKSYEIRREQIGEQIEIQVGEEKFTVEVRDPRSLRARRARGGSTDGPKKITAPMPGKVIRILAPEGTAVETGQGVVVIEAMKMQNELKSPKAGVVTRVMAVVGATVNPGDALAVVE